MYTLMQAIAAWRLGKIDEDELLIRSGAVMAQLEREQQDRPQVPVFLLAWLATVSRSMTASCNGLRPVFEALEAGDLERAHELVKEHTFGNGANHL